MMDGISLGLGVASLAIEVVEVLKTGYGIFVDAARFPEDCSALHLRLLFEYSRFLDWADVVGLSNPSEHARFEVTVRASRPLVTAVLREMQSRVETLVAIEASYNREIQAADTKAHAIVAKDIQSGTTSVVSEGVPIDLRQREVLTEHDTKRIEDIAQRIASRAQPSNRKHSRGFGIVVRGYKSVKQIASRPKSLVWAVKDKNKFRDVLGRLKELTDFLYESIDSSKTQTLVDCTRETYMAMLDMASNIADVKDLLESSALLTRHHVQANDDSASVLSTATTLVESRPGPIVLQPNSMLPVGDSATSLERLTKFKLEYQRIEASTAVTNEGLEIDFKTIEIQTEQPAKTSRTRATYAEKDVWIEWKHYKEDIQFDDGPHPDVVLMVRRLTLLLKHQDRPEEFRIPTCLGYCQDEDEARFGFVYERPLSRRGDYATLNDLLKRNPCSLQSRFKAAQDVAVSLMYLHTVGWLHKDLRSANISLSFDDRTTFNDIPAVSLSGFEYARQDLENVTATGPAEDLEHAVYTHPGYQGTGRYKGFKKSYDIYSLGIILIEIAYWKPASAIFAPEAQGLVADSRPRRRSVSPSPRSPASSRFGTATPSTPLAQSQVADSSEVRNRILNEPHILDGVRVAMGERYCSAVHACITGLEAFGLSKDVNETDPAISSLLQLAFLRLVVNSLLGVVI